MSAKGSQNVTIDTLSVLTEKAPRNEKTLAGSQRDEDQGFRVFFQARPTGLEPATTGSTVRYSNQLSYGPVFWGIRNYSRAVGARNMARSRIEVVRRQGVTARTACPGQLFLPSYGTCPRATLGSTYRDFWMRKTSESTRKALFRSRPKLDKDKSARPHGWAKQGEEPCWNTSGALGLMP